MYVDKIMKTKPVEEIIILPEKRRNIKRMNTKIIKMKRYKIYRLLNYSTVSKFITKKWIEINDLSSSQYSPSKNIMFKTSMLRSDLCDYSDAYIVVKGRISVRGTYTANRKNKKLTFKSNALLRLYISKINITFQDNAEDLNIVMPMYNLLEYSDKYSMTSGNLWNYYRDEVNDSANEIDDNDNKINSDKITTSKNFEHKTKVIGSTPNNSSRLDEEVVVPLKYLNNLWRSLDLLLINCERELELN